MAISRTSRLSVRASPDELMRWNHIARAQGHATIADWIALCGPMQSCLVMTATPFPRNCLEYVSSFPELATTSIN